MDEIEAINNKNKYLTSDQHDQQVNQLFQRKYNIVKQYYLLKQEKIEQKIKPSIRTIDKNNMHRKYTEQQIEDFSHDRQVDELHNRELISEKRRKQLTRIGNIFGKPIIFHQHMNQWLVSEYRKNDVSTQAGILTDNWRIRLRAYKNRFAFTEDDKRWERYLIYRYNHGR